ncbi:hypothetical protein VP1G_03090 [Cytospora mali]|uniref:BSD domain-containing protein n=1 Tax=Cytospora mali TaxID=578113 RepID=A0A194UV83_CYTMA|nr:hypothetical protein VP1G_03090 [Valsa mali var. pyri (nom. inval.)]
MDLAYDHIVEESLPKEEDGKRKASGAEQTQQSLNDEIQDAYKAFSASPWGAKIGGFFGTVVKQGESVYQEAQKELTAVGSEAQRGFTGLTNAVISRTRGLSLAGGEQLQQQQQQGEGSTKEMTTDEALQESETVLSRLRAEAAKRLKDVQRAEDAADEALLRFGTNIRDFLREAVSIAPPSATSPSDPNAVGGAGSAAVMFESKDASGKRTIPYENFWKRYYFLRHGIDIAEARRRDLLKAASAEEEVGWDEDSDDEAAGSSTKAAEHRRPGSTESSTTIHPPSTKASSTLLKPTEPRKSNDERSQPDSETSYDMVGAASGNPSNAPNSPKEGRKADDESDEEDWEALLPVGIVPVGVVVLVLALLEQTLHLCALPALPPRQQLVHVLKVPARALGAQAHDLGGDVECGVIVDIHLKLVEHDLQDELLDILDVGLPVCCFIFCFFCGTGGRGCGCGCGCGGEVGELLDDLAGEPVALVGAVGAAPVVLHGEGEGGPEVQGEGYALLEAGLAGCCV